MYASRYGHIVETQWQQSVSMFDRVEMDEFIVMPDHFHAIMWLDSGNGDSDDFIVGADWYPPNTGQRSGLSSFIRSFKGAVTSEINTARDTPGRPIWQRGYYDRVIRDDRELDAARSYVRFNVQKCLMMRERSGTSTS